MGQCPEAVDGGRWVLVMVEHPPGEATAYQRSRGHLARKSHAERVVRGYACVGSVIWCVRVVASQARKPNSWITSMDASTSEALA